MRNMICAVLLLVPAALPAQQVTEQPRTLSVSATGTVEREPEQGLVLLAVESEASTARAAAAANADKMSALVTALRQSGIAERNIRTVSYELRPEYAQQNRENPNPRIAGYRAVNMVQVTVDTVDRMGGVIDTSISNGANRVANIQFQLRDPRAAYTEALAIAVRNARREAEIVAEAAGERLGPAMNIHTGGFAPAPPPMPMYRRMDAMAMEAVSAPTPIEAGMLTTMASVQVVFRLLD